MRRKGKRNNHLSTVALVATILSQTWITASAAGPVDETAFKNAWALYGQQKYAASADAFETLIRNSTPNARLYYYAALANRGCNRNARAKQLCEYIVTNFSSTTESTYAQKLFPTAAKTAAATGAASVSDALPDSLKGKSVQELMKTEEGRKAVEAAIAQKEAAAAAAKAKVSPMMAKAKGGRPGERVFTLADIVKDGAGGIDQMYYPNCWFESSMSALAMLPRGQKLLADMVRYGPKEGTYVVRFPGDPGEYTIDEEKLEKTGIHNKALWATLIECAQTQKFPDDEGGQLYEGLAALTGQKAEYIAPDHASDQEITSFIEGATKSQNPIVCGTHHNLSGLPRLAFGGHAYTVLGYEPSNGMIKIRNPHGLNSQRFSLYGDPRHEKFEQLDDGVFRMHISLFRHYFSQVARSFI